MTELNESCKSGFGGHIETRVSGDHSLAGYAYRATEWREFLRTRPLHIRLGYGEHRDAQISESLALVCVEYRSVSLDIYSEVC